MAQQLFLPILTQIPIVILMVRWGQGHPVFGAAMGGLLGLGLAAYATELLCFVLGWLLYRRVGLKSRVLFLAHFDWKVIRTGFRFGGFEMLGSLAWAAGQAAEVAITQHGLINYAETWGNWVRGAELRLRLQRDQHPLLQPDRPRSPRRSRTAGAC